MPFLRCFYAFAQMTGRASFIRGRQTLDEKVYSSRKD